MKREEWWSVTRRTKWKGRPFAEKLRAKWRERRRRTKRDGNGGGIEMRKIRQEESCVTGRNVPGRSRRFRDRPEALRFARIEGRRRRGEGGRNGTRSGRAYSSGTATRRYVLRKEMSVWRTCRGCPRDTCTSVDFSWSE